MLTGNFPRNVMPVLGQYLNMDFDPSRDYFISCYPPQEADDKPSSIFQPVQTPIIENTLYVAVNDTPFLDDPAAFTDADADRVAQFIRERRAGKHNVWVNCIAGISRSGAIVELLTRLGWEDLAHWVQEERFPNPIMVDKLWKRFPQAEPYVRKANDPFWGPYAMEVYNKRRYYKPAA